jgi:hypothetical protein
MITVANRFYRIMDEYSLDHALSEGRAWYPNAWEVCRSIGKSSGLSPKRVAAVMAVTSPRARWSKNVAATYELCMDHVGSDDFAISYGVLKANSDKAIRILTSRYFSGILSGPKVTAFYANILGDTDRVTVDSIMSQAAGFSSDVSDHIRFEVEVACWQLADVFGITPRDAQASVWCAYRGSAA